MEKLGFRLAVLHSNTSSKNFCGFQTIKSKFWTQALKAWLDCNTKYTRDDIHAMDVACQGLWNNVNIMYKGKTLFFKRWIGSDILFVGDMFTDERFLTLDQVRSIVGVYPGIEFDYYALFNALGSAWRDPEILTEFTFPEPRFMGHKITGISSKLIRSELLKVRQEPPCCISFWQRKYPFIFVDQRLFSMAFIATKEVRLRVLQWKILHNIYPTSILLQKMKIRDSSNCKYCPSTRDFIEHFFCNCPKTLEIWAKVEHVLADKFNQNLKLTEEQKLFGIQSNVFGKKMSDEVNHIILIAKMCISKYKYGDQTSILEVFNYEMRLRKLI